MKKAYLTFDDGPSTKTESLISFLNTHNLPALFFCRGDAIEHNPSSILDAIKSGILIGNHSYSHKPAGDLDYQQWLSDFEKTESLINNCYKEAGVKRPGYYFRFPYVDKGDGDRLERRFSEIKPDTFFTHTDKMKQIQSVLTERGFTQPFKDVDHPLYKNPHLRDEADCLFTYSSCDWMMLDRHIGKWPYKTVDDLKTKMEQELIKNHNISTEILLFHDHTETHDITTNLITFALEQNISFLPFL